MPRSDSPSLPEQVKRHAKKAVEPAKPAKIDRNKLVPSGSTMLDLACSNSIYGAFQLGTMVNIIGDTSSGKTMVALSMLAECARLDRCNDFDLIFDDVEAANAFDLPVLFGRKLAARIQKPLKYEKSDTVKQLEANIIKSVHKDVPFIYVLDSFDALTTDEEIERAYARANDAKEKGSMGMQKAKGGHELFRVLCREIERAKGMLVVVSQVKENMDPLSFKKYKRTGGKALDFYAFHHIWLAVVNRIKEKDRVIGHHVRAKVEKNKLNGNERVVDYNTYNSYGIDNIGSMVDFMLVEKYWKPAKKEKTKDEGRAKGRGRKKDEPDKRAVIVVPELEIKGTRTQLVQTIDDEGLERRVKVMTADAWMEIEESLKLQRRPKYS